MARVVPRPPLERNRGKPAHRPGGARGTRGGGLNSTAGNFQKTRVPPRGPVDTAQGSRGPSSAARSDPQGRSQASRGGRSLWHAIHRGDGGAARRGGRGKGPERIRSDRRGSRLSPRREIGLLLRPSRGPGGAPRRHGRGCAPCLSPRGGRLVGPRGRADRRGSGAPVPGGRPPCRRATPTGRPDRSRTVRERRGDPVLHGGTGARGRCGDAAGG